MGLFSLIFGNDNKTNLKGLEKIAASVEELSDKYGKMTDDELKEQTDVLKGRLTGGETLDDILPDAFALVRETGGRVLSMRHFHVQLIGGICLHQGRIAEMRTGEGKTLVATLPAYLNALKGEGVHIVTVNDYLARRDAEWMGKIYQFLGLTVGVVYPGMEPDAKRRAYNCDITYCTNNELGFDYLRDNMVVRREDRVLRKLTFAVVDEVDSILVDEARTPLIISGRSEKSSELYITANRFVKTLKRAVTADEGKKIIEPGDYILDEEDKAVRITDEGAERAERFFGVENLTDVENTDINHYIQQALKANYVMKRESEYIVKDGEVIIVDEFTGRLMIGRRYSEGLHQAIEAKEGVRIQGENKTLATITFQNFFRLYDKLSGMTGTAKTEEGEFKSIYNLDVVIIPTNLPTVRNDLNDAIFKTRNGKNKAIIRQIEACYSEKQPILVGTVTVEKSEELSKLLKMRRIPHHILNAKNHEQEAFIIAQAGKLGAVTIATNMAGRGTDILLGGNPEFLSKEKMRANKVTEEELALATSYRKDLPPEILEIREQYNKAFVEHKAECDKEKREVIEKGGLFILGTERHESRRIDNQLRGRSGRQGDPGSSRFFISLEDDLAKFFGGERLTAMFNLLKVEEDEEISAKMVSKSIEMAQKRVEGRNFSVRKHVLEYDDVMNKQREIMYGERNKVLNNESVHPQILKMIQSAETEIIDESIDRTREYTDWDIEQFNKDIERYILPAGSNFVTEKRAEAWGIDYLEEKLFEAACKAYEEKILRYKDIGIDFFEVERVLLLRTVDNKWIDHIDAMDQLRRGISLRAYGNQNPVIAYKKEGFEMFDFMTERIQCDTGRLMLKVELQSIPEKKSKLAEATPASKTPSKADKKAGPNDPCPCGSGKKYKYCCGKI